MTIYLYSGTPGSGKSLHAAREMRYVLNGRNHKPVIGNVVLSEDAPIKNRDCYRYIQNWELTPELLYDFADDWLSNQKRVREDSLLLVLDEAQLIFNSREWQNQNRLAFLEFMSQHRKYCYRIILIAQNAKMIDNQFRMLIEYDVVHRKASNFGLLGSIFSAPFLGRLFCANTQYYQTGERLSSEWIVPSRRDMAMYDTWARYERRTDA